MKETLYDRNDCKLIERVCQLRLLHPDIKVGEIQRPITFDEVYSVVVEYEK